MLKDSTSFKILPASVFMQSYLTSKEKINIFSQYFIFCYQTVLKNLSGQYLNICKMPLLTIF